MPGSCPAPDLKDALVQGLLTSTDCNVRSLVEAGYGSLFSSSGAMSPVLTTLFVLYVALIGYALMFGRGPTSVGDIALSAIKLAAVIALATQWAAYSNLIYRFFFDGPAELAGIIQLSTGAHTGSNVFLDLQHAFDDLTVFSPAAPPGPFHRDPDAAAGLLQGQSPAQMTKPSLDALLLLVAAAILLVATLGVLIIAKVILGVLLAVGPLFIACFLFASARGLFVGWLRAALAAALVPLLNIVVLGVGLALLAPSLQQVELMLDTDRYIPGVAMGVLFIALLTAGASLAGLIAAAAVGMGFELSEFRLRRVQAPPTPTQVRSPAQQTRSQRLAESLALLDRRSSFSTVSAVEDPSPADASSGPSGRRIGQGGRSRLGRRRERL